MTSNDKNKQKLMESMRLTKAGAENSEKKAETAVVASKKATATRKSAATKKVAVTKKAVSKKKTAIKKKGPAISKKAAVDHFQSKGRVWPD